MRRFPLPSMIGIPSRFTIAAVFSALLAALPTSAPARGGGGCLERGSRVWTPAGEVAIESLRPGDAVLAFADGTIRTATVQAVTSVEPENYCELTAGGRRLRLTAEHPIETAPGVFRVASEMRAGDRLHLLADGRVSEATVTAARSIPASAPAYNLLVAPYGAYIANGIVVHNKGCFLPETPIRMADGTDRSISTIRPGDRVMAFMSDDRMTIAAVRAVLTHEVTESRIVRTAGVTLHVTAEHPFYVGGGTFKTLEALRVNDAIMVFDGQALRPATIAAIETVRAPQLVYNLQTDAPHTFLASGVAVHNKGGGGGGHSGGGSHGGGSHGGSGGGGSPAPVLIFFGVVLLIFIIFKARSGADENLDFVFKPAQVAKKQDKTLALLRFLAQQDASMAPEALRQQAQSVFLEMQRCWQGRDDYTPMRPLLMPDLYAAHLLQLAGMKRQHERNMIGDLRVDRVDLVNVRYTLKQAQREFTALITATACDYYVSDTTGKWLRGDRKPATFQEFWVFQRLDNAWRLREIEQTRESDALKTDNFFEQFTDPGVARIYGKQAGKEGEAGPWLERAAGDKETRIERMLNFLVQTDRIWNRQEMLETTSQIFLKIMAAQESGRAEDVPETDLFPEVAAGMRAALARNRDQGLALEFRNLCVRKVELALVRNYSDNRRDEFVARVRAHAQRVRRKGDEVVSQDEDVTPFEQFLTLGRLDNRWKVKELTPPASGRTALAGENLDEDSTPAQVQWYYSHTRAI